MKRTNQPWLILNPKRMGFFVLVNNQRRRFMMKYIEKNVEQLTMPLIVKEEGKHKQGEEKRIPAKRVDIVFRACHSPKYVEPCRRYDR